MKIQCISFDKTLITRMNHKFQLHYCCDIRPTNITDAVKQNVCFECLL